MSKNLNKKQKIELTITAIGILFLIFLIPARLKDVCSNKIAQDKSYNKTATTLSESPISGIEGYNPTENWDKDPFYPDIPFAGNGSGVTGFILNGIVWDSEIPYAIINDEIVKVGDKLDTATVVEINEKSVIVEQGNERHVLNLNPL